MTKIRKWKKVQNDRKFDDEQFKYLHEDHNIKAHLLDWRENEESKEDEKWGVTLFGEVDEDVVEHIKQRHYYESSTRGADYQFDFWRAFETKREAEEYIKALVDVLQAVFDASDRLESEGRTTAAMMTAFLDSDENDVGIRIGAEVTYHDHSSDLVRDLLNKLMSLHRVGYYGSGMFDVYKGSEDVSEEQIKDVSSANFNANFDTEALQEEMEGYQEAADDCPECGSSNTVKVGEESECVECGNEWIQK